MNIVELMDTIKSDPGAFLQQDCIFQLRAFLRGFVVARNTQNDYCKKEDHLILQEVDNKIRQHYNILPTARVSIEEILDDREGDNAFLKYIELWSLYVQKSIS